MRLRRSAALAAVVAAFAAPAALAGPIVDRAVLALHQSPVYVDPTARPTLDREAADRLRGRILRTGGGPIYIAILPIAAQTEAGGSTNEVLDQIGRRLDCSCTVTVVVAGQFRAGSTLLRRGHAGKLAAQSFRLHGAEGLEATLTDFVTRIAKTEDSRNSGGKGGIIVGVLLAIAVGSIVLLGIVRRRRQWQQLALVRGAAKEDLVALAEDVSALEGEVDRPEADPAAREDYLRALGCYERAEAVFDRARKPADLARVTAALEKGRFAMACTRARLEDRPPPERRPPCFFDPRHGPSARNVEWAPPGGSPRPVPACAVDAQRVEQGLEPVAREVLVDGQRVPYWQAPAPFRPWAGGYFGSFGTGLLPGLLVGSLLAGGLAFGDSAHASGGRPSDFDDFGGGDFGNGGGDLGGGDFGGSGGDFGGGGGGGDF